MVNPVFAGTSLCCDGAELFFSFHQTNRGHRALSECIGTRKSRVYLSSACMFQRSLGREPYVGRGWFPALLRRVEDGVRSAREGGKAARNGRVPNVERRRVISAILPDYSYLMVL